MKDHDRHIVGKVNIEINFNDAVYDHSLLGDIREAVLERIEASLKSIPLSGSEIILIDHLDINLNVQEYHEFPEALEEALKKSVTRVLSDDPLKKRIEKPVEIKGNEEKVWDLLVHYLKFGTLPWNWVEHPDLDLINDYLSKAGRETTNELRKLFRSEKALDRFCFELPVGVLDAVARGAHIFPAKLFEKVRSDFERLAACLIPSVDLLGISGNQFFRMALLMAVRDYWMQGRRFDQRTFSRPFVKAVYDYRNANQVSKSIWEKIEERVPVFMEGLRRGNSKRKLIKESHPDWEIVSEVVRLHNSGDVFIQSAAKYPKEYSGLTAHVRKPGKQKSSDRDKDLDNREKDPSDDSKKQNRLYVNNAGLVLLHPFLLPLFQELGLSNHQEFHGVGEKYQAIYVLQNLAGLDTSSKFGLALNKTICGMDVTSIMHSGFTWDQQISNECNKLLGSVIKHWSALKKTSISGLQTSFIQREGILEISDQRQKLIIEKKPYDILLEKLPWSVSMVKLPWMKMPLWVEW